MKHLQTCLAAVLALSGPALASAEPPQVVAQQVDEALSAALFNSDAGLAPRCDDAAYLRRVWLDVVGDIPSPEDLIGFSFDPSADKRTALVRRLLENPQYGLNWARYWRDVVFYRRIEERALIAANAMEADLSEHLNNDVPWDLIATDFITATGDVRENGATALIMAQDGRTEEVTAEISRIFLGTQIQCAQCHDHPYDRWKREQFHELAAFFPRLGVRNVRTATRRSFAVFASDRQPRRRRNNNERLPTLEHFMPDLDDPSAQGTEMQPRFFLTNAELSYGTADADRRQQIAAWLTDNQWFAVALVNRMWSELVGEGFYEPVDDIGPDREATAPEALEILAEGFVASGYDLKWLIETICSTAAYQRESRPRRGPDGIPFAANVPQPLRGDQLYNALVSALEIPEQGGPRRPRPGNPGRPAGPRAGFNNVFGFDPSDARETIAGSIPQALALMNSPEVASALRARKKKSLLGRLLAEIPQDDSLITELYLRTFSRQPTEQEASRARRYIAETNNRSQGFEDLLWALVNSAEFQVRP